MSEEKAKFKIGEEIVYFWLGRDVPEVKTATIGAVIYGWDSVLYLKDDFLPSRIARSEAEYIKFKDLFIDQANVYSRNDKEGIRGRLRQIKEGYIEKRMAEVEATAEKIFEAYDND